MKFIPAFLSATSIAYYCCVLLPQPVMENIENRMTEQLIMFLLGTIILCFVVLSQFAISTWYTPYLWMVLGVFYVLGSMMSYLGYSEWNVLWQDGLNDVAQIAMWLWDLTIAVCAFMMVESGNQKEL